MSDVQIKITAKDLASEVVRQLNGELDKTAQRTKGAAKETDRLKTAWKEAGKVIGGITVALVAMKKVYTFAKEGAALASMSQKFDRLAASVGSTSKALKDDLRKATGGLVADSVLVQSATELMSLGLSKTHEQTVRLATVSGKLGMDMNQLVLALSNQTTMRFDQLNLSVDGFDERLKKLKASGMSANDAFTEAFLQQAEAQILKTGDAANLASAKFTKMEAAWKNFVDAVKTPIIIPDIQGGDSGSAEDILQDQANMITEGKKVIAQRKVALQFLNLERAANGKAALGFALVTGHLGIYEKELKKYMGTAQTAIDTNADLTSGTADLSDSVGRKLAAGFAAMQSGTARAKEELRAFNAQSKEGVDMTNRLASETLRHEEAVAQLSAELAGLNPAGKKAKEVQAALDEEVAAHKAATEKIIAEFMKQELAAAGNWKALEALQLKLGEISKEDIINSANIDAVKSALDFAELSGGKVKEIMDYIVSLDGKEVDMTIVMRMAGASLTGLNLARPNAPASAQPQASGGQLGGGWALVGDTPGGGVTPYSELISPSGYVHNAKETRAILASGLVKPKSRAGGGSLKDQHLEGGPTDWTRYPYIMSSMSGMGPAYMSGGFSASSSAYFGATSQATSSQSVVTTAAAVVRAAVAPVSRDVASSQAQTNKLAAESAAGSARQSAILNSIDQRLAELNRGIYKSMRDAVAQMAQ